MTPRSTLDDPAVPVTAFIGIDAACDRLEAECRDGRRPDLAAYLDGVPDEARDLRGAPAGSVAVVRERRAVDDRQ